jgi:hypothetical protein
MLNLGEVIFLVFGVEQEFLIPRGEFADCLLILILRLLLELLLPLPQPLLLRDKEIC